MDGIHEWIARKEEENEREHDEGGLPPLGFNPYYLAKCHIWIAANTIGIGSFVVVFSHTIHSAFGWPVKDLPKNAVQITGLTLIILCGIYLLTTILRYIEKCKRHYYPPLLPYREDNRRYWVERRRELHAFFAIPAMIERFKTRVAIGNGVFLLCLLLVLVLDSAGVKP